MKSKWRDHRTPQISKHGRAYKQQVIQLIKHVHTQSSTAVQCNTSLY